MRVAITADVNDENAPVSMIFGRCPYYAIYDTSTDRLEFVPNPGGMMARGAGVQAGQFLIEQRVQMVITGGVVGPNAGMVLAQAGIQVINSFRGTVKDAIEYLKKNELGPSAGLPPRGPGFYPPPQYEYYPPEPQLTKEEEMRMLEEEKTRIEERLKEIKKRLKELKE